MHEFTEVGDFRQAVPLSSSVEKIACPLMDREGGGECDAAFIRSLFPSAERKNCSQRGRCIVRQLDKVDGNSVITLVDYNQAQKKPIPMDKILGAIDVYCSTHSV